MAAVGTRPGSVYGLLVGLGARASGMRRHDVAREAVQAVAAHFGAGIVTLHPTAEGWAEAVADPRALLAHLGSIDRARVETLDARLVADALLQDARVSALDLDPDLAAENFLQEALGVGDAFALPLRAGGIPAGALVVYLDAASAAPSETDLAALAGVGDVLALAGAPPSSLAPSALAHVSPARVPRAAAPPKPAGLLRRLFRS